MYSPTKVAAIQLMLEQGQLVPRDHVQWLVDELQAARQQVVLAAKQRVVKQPDWPKAGGKSFLK